MTRSEHKRRAVEISQQVETDISVYLLTIISMNALVGFAVGLAVWLCGLGDPLLWGTLAFILSGAHIGYLPEHIAAPWVVRGQLQALLPAQQGFSVEFRLAQHRARQPSEAQRALVEDLLSAFA